MGLQSSQPSASTGALSAAPHVSTTKDDEKAEVTVLTCTGAARGSSVLCSATQAKLCACDEYILIRSWYGNGCDRSLTHALHRRQLTREEEKR